MPAAILMALLGATALVLARSAHLAGIALVAVAIAPARSNAATSAAAGLRHLDASR
jgi:hypothetical protein